MSGSLKQISEGDTQVIISNRSKNSSSPENQRKLKIDVATKNILNGSPERNRKDAEKNKGQVSSTKVFYINPLDQKASELERVATSSSLIPEEPFDKEMVKPDQDLLEVPATLLDLEKEQVFESFLKAYANTEKLARKEFKERIPLDPKEREELIFCIQAVEEQCAKMRADLDESHIGKNNVFNKLILDLGKSKKSKHQMLKCIFQFLKIPKEHRQTVKNAFLNEAKGDTRESERHDAFLKSQLRFHIIYNYSLVFELIFEKLRGGCSFFEKYSAYCIEKSNEPFARLADVQAAITQPEFNKKRINSFCEKIISKNLDIESNIHEFQIHYIEKILNPFKIEMARQALVDYEAWKADIRLMYPTVTKFLADRFANTIDPDVFEDAQRAIFSGALCALRRNGVVLIDPYVNDWEIRRKSAVEALSQWINAHSGVCLKEQFLDSDLFSFLVYEINTRFGEIKNVSEEMHKEILDRENKIREFKLMLKKDLNASDKFYAHVNKGMNLNWRKIFDEWVNDKSCSLKKGQIKNIKIFNVLKKNIDEKFPRPIGIDENEENEILLRQKNIMKFQLEIKKNQEAREDFIVGILNKLERFHHKPKLEEYVLHWQKVFGEELLNDGDMMVELCRQQQELAEGPHFKKDPEETLFDGQKRIMGLILKKAHDPNEFSEFLLQLTNNLLKWKIKDLVTRKLVNNEHISFQDLRLSGKFEKITSMQKNSELTSATIENMTDEIFRWVLDEKKVDRIIPYPVMKIIQALTYMYGVSCQKNTEGLTSVFIGAWRSVLFPLDKREIEELPWKTSEKKRIEIVFDKDIFTSFMKRFKISSDNDPEKFYLFTQVMTYTRPHLGSTVEPFVTVELSYQTPAELPKEVEIEINLKKEKLALILAAQGFPPLKWSNPQRK